MLERVPQLNWPLHLFHDYTVAVNGTRIGDYKPTIGDDKCACGCGIAHRNAVSALEGEPGYRRVLWFRSLMCRNKYFKVGS